MAASANEWGLDIFLVNSFNHSVVDYRFKSKLVVHGTDLFAKDAVKYEEGEYTSFIVCPQGHDCMREDISLRSKRSSQFGGPGWQGELSPAIILRRICITLLSQLGEHRQDLGQLSISVPSRMDDYLELGNAIDSEVYLMDWTGIP